jgi:hypothetical protein
MMIRKSSELKCIDDYTTYIMFGKSHSPCNQGEGERVGKSKKKQCKKSKREKALY